MEGTVCKITFYSVDKSPENLKDIIMEVDYQGSKYYFDGFYSYKNEYEVNTMETPEEFREGEIVRWFYQSDLDVPIPVHPDHVDDVEIITKKGKKKRAWYSDRWYVYKKDGEVGNAKVKSKEWEPVSWRYIGGQLWKKD